MFRINEKMIFSLILCLFALLLLFEASGFRERAALLPNLIGYPLLVGSIILFIADMFPAVENKFKSLLFSGVNTMDGAAEGEESSLRGLYGMMLWMLFLLGMIYTLGVIFGVAVALFVYLKFMAKRSWAMSIVYPVIFTGFIYVVFVLAMDVYYFTSPVMEY